MPDPLILIVSVVAAAALVIIIKLAVTHITTRARRRIQAAQRTAALRAALAHADRERRISAFNRAYPARGRPAPVGPGLRPHPVHGTQHAPASTPSWVVPPPHIHDFADSAPGIGDTGTPTTCSSSESGD